MRSDRILVRVAPGRSLPTLPALLALPGASGASATPARHLFGDWWRVEVPADETPELFAARFAARFADPSGEATAERVDPDVVHRLAFGDGRWIAPAAPSAASSPATGLVAYGTWTVLGDQFPGAAWLLYAYDPDTDIAEGYLGVPEGPWYSEHGSVYGEQLLANPNMGRVASIPPGLTFATCMQLEHRVLDWLRTGRDPISEPDPDPLLATALDPPDHGPGALSR